MLDLFTNYVFKDGYFSFSWKCFVSLNDWRDLQCIVRPLDGYFSSSFGLAFNYAFFRSCAIILLSGYGLAVFTICEFLDQFLRVLLVRRWWRSWLWWS